MGVMAGEVVGWEEEDMAAVARVPVGCEEETEAAGATAKVVTALAMAAVAVFEASSLGATEAMAEVMDSFESRGNRRTQRPLRSKNACVASTRYANAEHR